MSATVRPTVRPLRYHGPGFRVDHGETEAIVWLPRAEPRVRPGVSVSWNSPDDGRFRTSSTFEDALGVLDSIPDASTRRRIRTAMIRAVDKLSRDSGPQTKGESR